MSNLSLVFQRVRYLDKVLTVLGMPADTLTGDEEERIKNISSFFLAKNLKWRDLKEQLLGLNEKASVEMVCLMEQYVREGEQSRNRVKLYRTCSPHYLPFLQMLL